NTSGAWTITTSVLTTGVKAITARAKSGASTSPLSNALTVTIDTSAPGTASVPDLDAASDTGSSSTDNITGDTTPTFNGTAEANSTVEILIAGVVKGSGTADGLGKYSVTTSALAA